MYLPSKDLPVRLITVHEAATAAVFVLYAAALMTAAEIFRNRVSGSLISYAASELVCGLDLAPFGVDRFRVMGLENEAKCFVLFSSCLIMRFRLAAVVYTPSSWIG